jgi:hypothetical protein
MSEPSPSPDALMLPSTIKRGGRLAERVGSIADVAEPLLGIVRGKGVLAHIRSLQHGRLFVTRDPEDTLYFHGDHPLAGQPRYRWEPQADGVEFGWLIEGEGATDAG